MAAHWSPPVRRVETGAHRSQAEQPAQETVVAVPVPTVAGGGVLSKLTPSAPTVAPWSE
ncbi:hypothetical protein GCM10027445_16840 [Amycolatopsis endophytica]